MTIIKQYNDNTLQWEAIAVGQKGDTGAGVANSGSTGQYLVKASNTDFDTTWVDLETDLANIAGNVIPATANTYDLGSANNTWRDLYLSGNSIFLGNVTITETEWDSVSTGVLPYDGTVSGLTANTVGEAIDETVALTDTAYSNAVTYADAVGNSAYSNAISYTDTAVANLIDTAPDALNTLNELAAALNDDPDFANTVVGQVTTAYTNATSYTDSAITALGLGSISTQNANNVSITGGSISGITDLAVADGGTGASDAAGARTNLGLGSISTQNNNAVNIDGGNIDGTAIGASSASSGAFTNLSYTGTLTGGTGVVNLGSGQVYKDATGNLGLGTTAPESRLVPSNVSNGIHIKHNNVPYLLFENTGASGKRWGLNSTSAGALGFYDGDIGSTRMTIAPSGNVGIGTTAPTEKLRVQGSNAQVRIFADQTTTPRLRLTENNITNCDIFSPAGSGALAFSTDAGTTQHMRIESGGSVLVGKTTTSGNVAGVILGNDGYLFSTRSAATPFFVNRLSNDGALISFSQDTTEEGTISVSGSTVSYNGGHLARWSRLPSGEQDKSILKGTVMTNLDAMVEWNDEENEQLNQMAVSSVEGDPNVAGVFVNWDNADDWNDMNVAMTGDMIIRIGAGVTVQRGDLLMSAGDGTAKPQEDDVVKSKTIAKVTSTHVTCTYDDGSYCVPCVLMAC